MNALYAAVVRWTVAIRSARGATTAEYALVLALVAIFLITALSSLGQALSDKITSIADQLGGN